MRAGPPPPAAAPAVKAASPAAPQAAPAAPPAAPESDVAPFLEQWADFEAAADARQGPVRFEPADPSPPDGRAGERELHGPAGEQYWLRATPAVAA
eukprot:7274286-Alexandrium_andersonii.AAC.1